MADDNDNPWNNDKYDPEAERCCKDCGKTFKTKEGVLHGKYDFHCSPCHIWWKKTYQKIYWGVGISVVIIALLGILFLVKYLKSDETPRKKRKIRRFKQDGSRIEVSEYYDDEEDDDD